LIELRGVSIVAGGFVLHGIEFNIDAGEHVMLMGKTGCGKTTILEAICGLREVTAGTIILDGVDVTTMKPGQRNTGFVPQDLALFPTMTVRQHLEFGAKRHRFDKARISKKVGELSKLLGINELLERRVDGLSGGEAQRVALGRALSFEPPVLLLDEPFSALDEWTRDEMYVLLRGVRETTGVTVLHITHSRTEADVLGDRCLLLEKGSVRDEV